MILHSSRPDARTDLLHGTLDMLILRTLQWGPQWGQTEANQRAKFYRLTPEGKKQLLREQSRWAELVHAISRVMTPVPAPASEE